MGLFHELFGDPLKRAEHEKLSRPEGLGAADEPPRRGLLHWARAIAHSHSDEFRLGQANLWTEAHHTKGKGSYQTMRLKDGKFLVVSVGLNTIRVFVTSKLTDPADFLEIKRFDLPNGPERLRWRDKERHAEDLILLDWMRRAIAWPNSTAELVTTLDKRDSTLPLVATKRR
jgi:hypothetical protein